MILIPEKRTIGYLISEVSHEFTTSFSSDSSPLMILRYDWRSESGEEPIPGYVDDVFDERQLAARYAEFADEDRELEAQGLREYAALLDAEDRSN